MERRNYTGRKSNRAPRSHNDNNKECKAFRKQRSDNLQWQKSYFRDIEKGGVTENEFARETGAVIKRMRNEK